MRRATATVILLGMLFAALAACGDRGLDRAAGQFESSTPGTLTVATSEIPEPGFWEGEPGDPTGGFEYELAGLLADKFGLDELDIVVVSFADIASGDLGGADIALSLVTPTGDRDQALDFSEPYLRSPPALLVDSGVEVPDLETARGLSYAVEQGTTLEAALLESVDPEQAVSRVADQQAAVDAVRDGDVDAAMLDLPAAVAIAAQDDGLAVAAKLDRQDTVAVALPQGEAANAEATSSAIRALASDGTLAELSEQWLGEEIIEGAPGVPLLRSSR